MSLSEASRVGNLPCLTHLNFENCALRGNLSLLFSSPWPQLKHLGFYECDINIEDFEIIGNMKEDPFPNLISLSFTFPFSVMQYLNEKVAVEGDVTAVVATIELNTMSYLKSLHLAPNYLRTRREASITHKCLPPSPQSLTLHKCVCSLQILADNLFRNNLRHLDISFNRIQGTLFTMMCNVFPSLATLILCECGLSSIDLSSLAKANAEDRLPKLNHLDISSNPLDGTKYSLFDFSCKWNQLLSLNIMYTNVSVDDLHRRVQSGCLSSLQELRISDYPHQPVDIVWPHLLSGYHADTPITIKAEPSIWPTAAFINIHEHPL